MTSDVLNESNIRRVALALCEDSSSQCGTDPEDEWKFYSKEYRHMATVALTALANVEATP